MAERFLTLTLDAVTSSVSGDIGKLVNTLLTLVLSPKHCKTKCMLLATKISLVYNSIRTIEEERAKDPTRFDEAKYGASVDSFRQVVQDSIDLVERYQNKTIIIKFIMSLKLEDDFDSLDQRLETCIRYFHFNLQLINTTSTCDIQNELQELKEQVSENFKQIKNLLEGKLQDPEDSFLSGVSFGEPVLGGFIVSGRLNNSQDIILIASQQETKEAAIMKRLSECENVLQFLGRYSREGTVYAVMQRPGSQITTLDDLISESNVLKNDWRLKRMIALEIAMGIGYAHVAGILHKNLRSPNIFLTDGNHPKIFGFLQGRIKTEPSDKKFNNTAQVRWAAPEMLKKDRPPYNEQCDIFSLGVILWELITHDYPFSDLIRDSKVIVGRIKEGRKLEFVGYTRPGCCSGALQELIQVCEDCMESQPDKRPGIGSVIERLSSLVPEEMQTYQT